MRKIPGFDGYSCTEDGRIFSAMRVNVVELTHVINLQGYHQVTVVRDGKKYRTGVHRLVALAYLENDDPKKIHVHHIDHDKSNNHFTNLEWCTPSYNIEMNYKTGGQIPKAGLQGRFGRDNPETKIVKQYHPEDGLVAYYWGLKEAARATRSNPSHISQVCLGSLKRHNGFIWRYLF